MPSTSPLPLPPPRQQLMTSSWTPETLSKLQSIAETREKEQRVANLRQCDENTLICCVELICNLLAGNVPIVPHKALARLKRQQTAFRRLSTLRDTRRVRQFLIQRGGNPLVSLLPILTSVLPVLVEHVIKRL